MKNLIILLAFVMVIGCYDDSATPAHMWKFNYSKEYQGVNPSLLFIGDSRIDAFDIPKYFNNHAFNYGHQGYTTKTVLRDIIPEIRAKEIETDIVIISLGINDLSASYSHLEIIHNMGLIVDNFPNSTIYITNIVPYRNRNIDDINLLLYNFCVERNIQFIDCIDMEDENGFLRNDLSIDIVHYSESGNDVFGQCLLDGLNKK